ncbi:MAG: Alpha/beta hydrolase fold protein [Candidatus Beckwithbacteria bacterium GW2011_GWA2_43_10]|uniref:Alpha/beta hydrolase fold protein n=1 Tax=Candidatus Beckwithbacteria bacterium GW2011_GWA2_43_10 TaxID=1618369 RepID=A0A0G1C2V4_9BACT|nr:MAG: Alpha/beta hydrolase fold protein [Candidatus Beckwithbacteria bacterium GW2011_GWA2_43_10]
MLNYPIVKVKTKDGLELGGMLFEPEDKKLKTIKIHIPGDNGSFWWSDYYPNLAESSLSQGIAFLSVNSRGTGAFENSNDDPVSFGVAVEIFSDCILDFDAWIKFTLDKGYQKIILEGHSRGTEKTVYYLNHGHYVDKVVGVILMGFSDAIGTQLKHEQKIGHNFMAEAERMVEEGKGDQLLSDLRAFCGELPMTAKTYLDNMKPDSANAKAIPLRQGKNLAYFKNIKVPVLGVIGDHGEYTIIQIEMAIELLKKENPLAEAYQIKDCDHCYIGKEKELTKIIADFTKRRILPNL